ncbi:hypothetical protein ZWY2020_046964, partial [Hordeum vulgare]
MIRDPLACDDCFHLILAKTPAPSRYTTCASINLQPIQRHHHVKHIFHINHTTLFTLDGGISIPYSGKMFVGFKKEGKQMDAEIHRKYIYEVHVSNQM